MQTTQIIYGIWDEFIKSWMICEFTEQNYDQAKLYTYGLNKAYNRKNKKNMGVPYMRYTVKARGGDIE